MSRLGTHRSGGVALALAAVAATIALVAFGLRTIPVRTFALDVPYASPVATIGRGHEACEGPVRSAGPMRLVGIFGGRASGAPRVRVIVRSGGRTLASGPMAPSGVGPEHLVALDAPIAGGIPVRVCVRALGGTFSLYGSGAQSSAATTGAVAKGMQFALVLDRRSSLLGSLGTAFSRAAIFRPHWVGPWTFWLLLGALVGALGLLGRAVLIAAGDDSEPPAQP